MPTSINEPQTPAHQEVAGAVAPVISSLEPPNVAVGANDFTLTVHGQGFTEHSVIFFAGHDEPTTLSEDGSMVSTGVKPSLWQTPCKIQVYVHNGTANSAPLEFEFTAPAEDTRKVSDGTHNELVLDSIKPDHVPVGNKNRTVSIVVTGSGFDEDCVVLCDDEEVLTDHRSDTELRALLPMQSEPAEVDIEVQRGDDTSDVLTFEFTAEAREPKKPERKPKKSTPSHKRMKKSKR